MFVRLRMSCEPARSPQSARRSRTCAESARCEARSRRSRNSAPPRARPGSWSRWRTPSSARGWRCVACPRARDTTGWRSRRSPISACSSCAARAASATAPWSPSPKPMPPRVRKCFSTSLNTSDYPRDLVGYGLKRPKPKWPGSARVALQFVLNYEEGGENSVLHGDKASEAFLSEIIGAQPLEGVRHMSMESIYEYGSRVGVWRVLDLFSRYEIPFTVYGVAMAMERNPAAVEALLKEGNEIASHGWRWISYQHVPEEVEREHMQRAIEIHTKLTGERPLGWYTGRTSPNTRRLVVEDGGFVYDADDYNDDLPWYDTRYRREDGTPQLIVPYTLDANDMRFATAQGFNSGDQFYAYLKDAFDMLYEEGAKSPKMMSIGLHCRLVGRPGRFASLKRFLDYVLKHDKAWVCRRIDIARHWHQRHPYQPTR